MPVLSILEKLDETKSQEMFVNGNLAYIIVVLLNEDPVSTPDDTFSSPGETGLEKLKKLSER